MVDKNSPCVSRDIDDIVFPGFAKMLKKHGWVVSMDKRSEFFTMFAKIKKEKTTKIEMDSLK